MFASLNTAQLSRRMVSELSAFPAYFYNEFASFHLAELKGEMGPMAFHCDADYTRLCQRRTQRLVERMRPDAATTAQLARDAEFCDFLDPATRFTSEDATQHRTFCATTARARARRSWRRRC